MPAATWHAGNTVARAPSDKKRIPPAANPDAPPTPRPATPFRLRDDEVERALRTGEQSGVMEDLFGPAGLQELSRLAREAEAAGVRGGDRVLILPGIMGSKLGYADPVLNDEIWIDPFDIAAGRLEELRLDGPTRIGALSVLQTAYLALKFRLRIRGHAAEFFPFD